MAVTPVTPVPGQNTEIVTAGSAVQVFPANINGGIITNPYGAPAALIINPVGSAAEAAGGTGFALQPGQSWAAIAGQTTPTTANSTANTHVFSAVYW